ncbi:hypothetical protein C8Q78DRAFT_994267 [Trametes maxima]|nr:hypothetical protein C8Q78DRAFT_994267 [Trametes maxima]
MPRNSERHVRWVDSEAVLDDETSPSAYAAIVPPKYILQYVLQSSGNATQGQGSHTTFRTPMPLSEAQRLAQMAHYTAGEESLQPLLLGVQPAFPFPSAGANAYPLTNTIAGTGANYHSPSSAVVTSPAVGVPPADDIDPSPAAVDTLVALSAHPSAPVVPSPDFLLNFPLLWDVRRTSFNSLRLDDAVLDSPAFPDGAKTCILHFLPDLRGRAPADEFAFTTAVEHVDADDCSRLRLRVRDVLAAVVAKLLEGRGAGYIFEDHAIFGDARAARELRLTYGRNPLPDTACWARMDVWPGAGLFFRGLNPVGVAEGGVQVYAVRLESQRLP